MTIPLRIHGKSPGDKRRMATDWLLVPVAEHYFRERGGNPRLVFAVRPRENGFVQGRFFARGAVGGEPLGGIARVMARIYMADEDALDDDRGFAEAFLPLCRDTEWTAVAELRWRKAEKPKFGYYKTHEAAIEWLLQPLEIDEPKPAPRELDAEVEGVVEGLEALDRIDQLLPVFKKMVDIYYEDDEENDTEEIILERERREDELIGELERLLNA